MSPTSSTGRLLHSLVLTLALVTVSTSAPAQEGRFGEPLGHLYFSSEATSYNPVIIASSFTPFVVYLVVDLDYADIGRAQLNANTGIQAWEMGMQLPGLLESDFLVLNAIIRNRALNVGNQTNVIVGLSPAVLADQTPIDLVEYQMFSPVSPIPTDVTISAGPSSPSSFDAPLPGWSENSVVGECFNPVTGAPAKCLRTFAQVSPAVINPSDCFGPMLHVTIASAEIPTDGTGVVTVDARLIESCHVLEGNPADLAGIDLELIWNGDLAELVDVRTTDATAAWSLESNVAEGSVRISAANAEGLGLGLDPRSVLELEFAGRGETGSTSLVVGDFSFFDSSPSRIDATFVAYGTLELIPCERFDPLDDDVVNSGDAILALKIVTGQIFPTTEVFCSADTDGDGTVDTGDVIRILRRAVGLEKTAESAVVTARTRIDSDGSTVRLRLEGAAGLEGSLHYDASVLRPVDVTGADDAFRSINRDESGVIRFAVASTEPLDSELRLAFEPVSGAPVAVVRLGEIRGFDSAGEPIEVQRQGSEVSLRLGPPELRGTRLVAAVPNPFNPRTEIRLHLERASDLRLRIYDTAGREVRNLDRRGLSAGDHAVEWDGLDDQGRRAASGVYFVRMQADGIEEGLRAVLLK